MTGHPIIHGRTETWDLWGKIKCERKERRNVIGYFSPVTLDTQIDQWELKMVKLQPIRRQIWPHRNLFSESSLQLKLLSFSYKWAKGGGRGRAEWKGEEEEEEVLRNAWGKRRGREIGWLQILQRNWERVCERNFSLLTSLPERPQERGKL